MKKLHILLVLLLAFGLSLLITGCINSYLDQPQPPLTSDETAHENSTTEEPTITESPDISERQSISTLPSGLEPIPTQESKLVVGEAPKKLLGEILSDLVERTGAEHEAIKVLRAEAMVWYDGALGCPKPGEVYIQVLIDGYWVVLEVEGVEYDYRASDKGSFRLCESGNNKIELIPVMLIAPHGKTPKGDLPKKP